MNTLLELGRVIVNEVKNEEFYENVNWSEFEDSFYEIIGTVFAECNIEGVMEITNFHNGVESEYSDNTYDSIKFAIEPELMQHYDYNETLEQYVKKGVLSNNPEESLKGKLITNFIKIDGEGVIPINSFEELTNLKLDNEYIIDCCYNENQMLSEVINDNYQDCELGELIADLTEILNMLEWDYKALERLLFINNVLEIWTQMDIKYYKKNRKDALIEYLDGVVNLSHETLKYMDIEAYVENELDLSINEGEGFTIIYDINGGK